jgi:hypothetical protein
MSRVHEFSRRGAQLLLIIVMVVFSLSVTMLSAQEEPIPTATPEQVDEFGVPLHSSVISREETPEGIYTVTQIPVAMDTFATSGIPEGQIPQAFTNYGGRTDLRLGYNTANSHGAQRIYLWFNVAAAGIPSNATINWANVHIWTSDSAGDMGFEARHLNSSWNEFSLTWMSNRPQWGGSLGTGVVAAGSGERVFVATNLVREWITGVHPNNGIIVIGNEGTAAPFERVFHAREAANGLFARLIVDWNVAIDTVPPESTITQLPPFSRGNFLVSWSGTDAGNPPSGIAHWDVDFSTDGVNWTQWLRGTTAQSANWQGGTNGVRHFFRVRAVDRAGNFESWTRNPAQQQTNTMVDTVGPNVTLQPLPEFTYDTGFPVTWTGNDGGLSGTRSYTIQFNVNGGPWQFAGDFQFGDGQFTRWATGAVNGETYGVRVRGTDNAGNVGAWSNESFTTVYTTPPFPRATVLPIDPPGDRPGISDSAVFNVTWLIEAAPGTTAVQETSLWYSCDGGTWVQWLNNAPGTFAEFDSTVNNSGCTPGQSVHLYRFEATGKAEYPGPVVRVEQRRGEAEASIVVDPEGEMIVRAYFPVIAQSAVPGAAATLPTAPPTSLQFVEPPNAGE